MDRFQKPLPGQVFISVWTVIKIILVVLGLWLLWFLREIFAILLAALLLAVLIEPLAAWLNRRRIPRGAAVILVYFMLCALMASVLVLLVPVIIGQVAELLSKFSASYDALLQSFAHFKELSAQYGLTENFRATINSLQSGLTNSAGSLFSTFRGFLGGLVALLVVLVLAFYLVVEEQAARSLIKTMVPFEYQPYIFNLFSKIQKKLGAWLRGQLILGLIVGLLVYLGLSLLGVESALLLAVIAGLFEIIPYIGPILAVLPAALIGFTHSSWQGILVIGLYIIIQQFENHVLVPKVMQKTTGLNPVISIIAILVGVKLGGFVGVLLAIPLAVIAMVVIDDLFNQPPS